jgi:hypothetical protein
MAQKLPKDTRRLVQFILDHGGYAYRDGGELVIGHVSMRKRVRTQVKSRRKDSSMDLYNLAKALRG